MIPVLDLLQCLYRFPSEVISGSSGSGTLAVGGMEPSILTLVLHCSLGGQQNLEQSLPPGLQGPVSKVLLDQDPVARNGVAVLLKRSGMVLPAVPSQQFFSKSL
jgi:hypothetical protein